MNKIKFSYALLAIFILVKFILQYSAINAAYDLHRDEYLHLDMANHLAWGYQSVPPLTAVVSLIIKFLGNGVFWVKFFPALFGSLVIILCWRLIEKLNGGLYAQILMAATLLFSVLLRINTLYQPNSIDILFWTICNYLVVEYIRTKENKLLLWLGIAFGVGVLGKYNIAFWLLGLLPALLFSEHKNLLLNRYFGYAVLIALLIVTPNLYWQFTHQFPVIHHMQDLTATQLVNDSRFNFIKEQFLFFIGGFYLVILALLAFWIYSPFKTYRILFWSFLFSIALFMYFRAKGYYALGLYPVIIVFGSIYTEYLLTGGWKEKIRYVLIALAVIIFIPFCNVAFPVLKPEDIQLKAAKFKKFDLLRWEDGKDHELPQDFADMLGWSELAKKVDKLYATIPNKENTLVLCDNYGEAGSINYYSKNKNIQAVSFNADYIDWFPLERHIKNIILIKQQGDSDITYLPRFRSTFLYDSISNSFARELGTRIYYLEGAQVNMNERLKIYIAAIKKEHKGY